ncbi:hypothetical protein AB0H83_46915 [Dactylosporangium sp. NPDC050688]|uniref:hypothetical protein n=1 Tax=Dactylosporangium sp. NPDC050688 TaxID=3157217 RepID=UPI003409233D
MRQSSARAGRVVEGWASRWRQAAATDADRAAIVAAGTAALAAWQGTAFHVAYLLGSVAGILLGVMMLRGAVFGRLTAWLAITANTVGLGLYIPRVGVYVAVASVLFLEIWYGLVAWHLWRLGGAGPGRGRAARDRTPRRPGRASAALTVTGSDASRVERVECLADKVSRRAVLGPVERPGEVPDCQLERLHVRLEVAQPQQHVGRGRQRRRLPFVGQGCR